MKPNYKFLMPRALLTIIMIILQLVALAQTGTIKGRVLDKSDNKPLIGAQVFIKSGANLIGDVTDIQGYFTLKPLQAGVYEVTMRYLGYNTVVLPAIQVNSGNITFVKDVKMEPDVRMMDSVVIIGQGFTLIDKDNPQVTKLNPKDLENLPESRNLPAMLAYMTSQIMVSDNNRQMFVRGSRDGDVSYIVDGIRVPGTDPGIPGGSIGSCMVYTSGIPANYGDVTGGVVVIETKSYFDWLAEKRAREAFEALYGIEN